MYTYGRFMLRFDRKQHNSVKQLSLNKKINKLKKDYSNYCLKEESVLSSEKEDPSVQITDY